MGGHLLDGHATLNRDDVVVSPVHHEHGALHLACSRSVEGRGGFDQRKLTWEFPKLGGPNMNPTSN